MHERPWHENAPQSGRLIASQALAPSFSLVQLFLLAHMQVNDAWRALCWHSLNTTNVLQAPSLYRIITCRS